MKTIACTFVLIFLTVICKGQSPVQKTQEDLLDFYCQYSAPTHPGEYEYLYRDLPDELPELCHIIRSQFIHPFAVRENYRELIPRERWSEMYRYPDVKSILKGLLALDSRGIVKKRKPENCLILGCQQNAILLASVLRYKNIPVRVRSGHATYLIPDFHGSHTICEVWNKAEQRWMLVDPSTERVDFDRSEFDISNELWVEYQNKKIDPEKYGLPGRYSGCVSIVGKVSSDLAALLGQEPPITAFSPVVSYAMNNNNQIREDHVEILNRVCDLMENIDAKSFSKLLEFYNKTPEIQITESFDFSSKQKGKTAQGTHQ